MITKEVAARVISGQVASSILLSSRLLSLIRVHLGGPPYFDILVIVVTLPDENMIFLFIGLVAGCQSFIMYAFLLFFLCVGRFFLPRSGVFVGKGVTRSCVVDY